MVDQDSGYETGFETGGELKSKDEEFDRIIEKFNSIDSDDRRWAVYDLEDYKPEDCVEFIVRAIQDEHRAVREAAAEALKTYPAETCSTLLVPLLGSPRIELRNITASVLTALGDGAVLALNDALFHENEDVRKFGADILGLNGSHEAVPHLCKAVYDEVDNVAVSAIEALGKIGSPEALGTLYDIYVKQPILRLETIEAIGLIGQQDSIQFLLGQIRTEDSLELYSILDALGNIGDNSVLCPLIELLKETSGLLRDQVFCTLLKIGQSNNLNVLNDLPLSDDILTESFEFDEDISIYLNHQLGLEPSIDVLQFFYRHADSLPSDLLVSIVHGTPGNSEFLPRMIYLSEYKDDWVAYAATEALAKFDHLYSRAAVMKKLSAGTGLAVIAAINVATQMEIDGAEELIRELTNSEDEDIKATAMQALGMLD